MRILNQTAIRDHALACSKQIRGGKFSRVSESFISEIQLDFEAFVRSLEAKYPPKIHGNLPHTLKFVTGELLDKLSPLLDNAIARLIQRRVEQHPSVGFTLQGK